ncbi:hypothetical protein QFZ81_001017 [Paenibacillus sp. V4I9]|uniref:DUF2971 domain-containing protein n=1 Tax=Paenibacillus sp. V4I9 TaxID=3042308 RepID=UPI0027813B81|nr:DUF2971 domain-containing protein [Paenibacillus sp. V4I9]MDQ0885929.1 hypothetical protein [Paenibacillus sp. V4I9]
MWIDDYIKLKYPINNKLIKMEEAMLFKYEHIPTSLYKYRAVNEFSLKNLEEDTVWVTNAVNFNDPYDCALNMEFNYLEERIKRAIISKFLDSHNQNGVDKNQLKGYSTKSLKELCKFVLSYDKQLSTKPDIIDEFAESMIRLMKEENDNHVKLFVEKAQKGTFIACFSELNDSILMWSHYANNHKGFCVEYDFKQCGNDDVLTRSLQPVIYTDKMFDMSVYMTETLEDHNNLISIYSAIIKSKEWAYEREWRLTFPMGVSFESFNRAVTTPKAVYLGTKISEDDQNKVLSIANRRNIPVFKMSMRSDEFKLVSGEL